MSSVTTTVDSTVAVLRFGTGPVNSLGYETRRDLAAAVEAANAMPGVTAIVIAGNNATFSGGADIREFGTPAMLQAPNLLDLIAWHRATGPMRLIQGHAQVPYRAVALAPCTFAIGITAGEVALHQ